MMTSLYFDLVFMRVLIMTIIFRLSSASTVVNRFQTLLCHRVTYVGSLVGWTGRMLEPTQRSLGAFDGQMDGKYNERIDGRPGHRLLPALM